MKKSILLKSLAVAVIALVFTAAQNTYEVAREGLPAAEEQMASLGIGDKAPDIAMTDPSGKVRKLSDLKGKVVLIDFWASWCRPCRMENPNVVKTYNEFKDERFQNGDGFEVFSVSLDQNKTAWENGIQQDGLVWENHVSDLQYWKNAAARLYNVNSIPATFLIDGNGVIIKKNLRGEALRNTLESMKK
jgi:peroxiredoxin